MVVGRGRCVVEAGEEGEPFAGRGGQGAWAGNEVEVGELAEVFIAEGEAIVEGELNE